MCRSLLYLISVPQCLQCGKPFKLRNALHLQMRNTHGEMYESFIHGYVEHLYTGFVLQCLVRSLLYLIFVSQCLQCRKSFKLRNDIHIHIGNNHEEMYESSIYKYVDHFCT